MEPDLPPDEVPTPELPDILDDLPPPPEPFRPPWMGGGSFESPPLPEFKDIAESASLDADRHMPLEFDFNEQQRERQQQQVNAESLRIFKRIAIDLGDDASALHALRTRMEANRMDLADGGL